MGNYDKYLKLVQDYYDRTEAIKDPPPYKTPEKVILVKDLMDIGDNFVEIYTNFEKGITRTYVNDVLYKEIGNFTDELYTEHLENLDYDDLTDIDYKVFM